MCSAYEWAFEMFQNVYASPNRINLIHEVLWIIGFETELNGISTYRDDDFQLKFSSETKIHPLYSLFIFNIILWKLFNCNHFFYNNTESARMELW